MENKNNTISWGKYISCVSNVESMDELELKGALEELKGKQTEDDYEKIDDCGVYFISRFLTLDWGRSIVCTYNSSAVDFVNSKYLSDYFKDNMRELLEDTMTDEIEDILNSDKDINQMSGEEIKIIYDAVEEYYHINGRSPKSNISSNFLAYIYKLNGDGVSSFLKKYIDGESLARRILLTSGVNDSASYYSGRGVNYGDLNENNLVAMFEKLVRIDKKFALNFVKMVCGMKTLGASEFITSFIRLGRNKFEYSSKKITSKNISLDGVHGEARDAVAFISVLSTMNRRDDDYQIVGSESMKRSFISKIWTEFKNLVGEEDFDLDIDNLGYSYGRHPYRRR